MKMKIIRNIADIQADRESAVTVGTFDGVHLGHQSILNRLFELAGQHGYRSTIVTFEPHPRKVLGKPGNTSLGLLTTIDEKLNLFEELGLEQIVIIPFTREFAAKSAEEFVKEILLDRLRVQEMVIGHDHHFGRNREGTFEKLKELGGKYGFRVYQVPPLEIDGQVVSSSAIRKLISEGKMELVHKFLGRNYSLSGTVVHGDGRGKEIGFPTANLQVTDSDKMIPAKGVYAVDVQLHSQIYRGMMNIGVRPTFDHDSLTLEVHLFNFNASIYGEALTVKFKRYIRPEKKFSGIEALREQLQQDKLICERLDVEEK